MIIALYYLFMLYTVAAVLGLFLYSMCALTITGLKSSLYVYFI